MFVSLQKYTKMSGWRKDGKQAREEPNKFPRRAGKKMYLQWPLGLGFAASEVQLCSFYLRSVLMYVFDARLTW